MKKSRLLMLVVALALTFGAVATTPAAAEPAAAIASSWQCEEGCWAWDIENGCTQEVTCCASSSGDWFCILW